MLDQIKQILESYGTAAGDQYYSGGIGQQLLKWGFYEVFTFKDRWPVFFLQLVLPLLTPITRIVKAILFEEGMVASVAVCLRLNSGLHARRVRICVSLTLSDQCAAPHK